MIRVQTIGVNNVRIQPRADAYAGDGVTVNESAISTPPPPGVNNGILLEDSVSFLMMEDTTSYLLQEA